MNKHKKFLLAIITISQAFSQARGQLDRTKPPNFKDNIRTTIPEKYKIEHSSLKQKHGQFKARFGNLTKVLPFKTYTRTRNHLLYHGLYGFGIEKRHSQFSRSDTHNNENFEKPIHDDGSVNDFMGSEALDLPLKEITKREFNRSTSKSKRFLSNLKSSLKKHLKNRHGNWGVSGKEAEKLFKKYYQCITDRLKLLQAEELPIKAFMAVEGEKIMMECAVCYRPDVDAHSQRAVWQVLRHEATDIHKVTMNKKFKVINDNTLVIKDIDVNDAGQYYCVENHDYLALYQLDVFLTDKRKHLKVGFDQPRPEEYLLKRNLRVFTTWAPWSECNSCDLPGQRIRIGQCTVKKLYEDIPIFPKDYPLMVLYPDGVPCHSTALPGHIRHLPQVGGRHSETLVLPCMEACPTQPPAKVVTDKSGKVLEILDPGYYSIKDKPVIKPMVKRKVMYEPEKLHLVLHCPGDHDKALLHWARGEKTIDPAFIKRRTKGRVYLDSQARLHFKPLLLSDTSVYNCWVKDRRLASIKLLVVDEANQNIKIYISYAGLGLLTVGSIIMVFCLCCKKSEHNAR